MKQVETERLLLRQWRDSDFEPYAAFFSDEEQAFFVGGACSRPMAWRRLAAVIGHWSLRGFGYWAVEEKSSGDFVGCVGLWYPEGWSDVEVSYWICADKQGKGYASEAARKARDIGFDFFKLKTLISYIHADNIASQRVAERLGAVYETDEPLLDFGIHRAYRYPHPTASR